MCPVFDLELGEHNSAHTIPVLQKRETEPEKGSLG